MRLCKIWALTMGSRIVRHAAVHLWVDANCVVNDDRGKADALAFHWGVEKVGKIRCFLLHMLAENLAAAVSGHVIL
jgi:hypothetical protein